MQPSMHERCRSSHAGKQQVVYGHRDFEYMLPGNVRASFIWAPYAANLTTMYTNWYALIIPPALHGFLAGSQHEHKTLLRV